MLFFRRVSGSSSECGCKHQDSPFLIVERFPSFGLQVRADLRLRIASIKAVGYDLGQQFFFWGHVILLCVGGVVFYHCGNIRADYSFANESFPHMIVSPRKQKSSGADGVCYRAFPNPRLRSNRESKPSGQVEFEQKMRSPSLEQLCSVM